MDHSLFVHVVNGLQDLPDQICSVLLCIRSFLHDPIKQFTASHPTIIGQKDKEKRKKLALIDSQLRSNCWWTGSIDPRKTSIHFFLFFFSRSTRYRSTITTIETMMMMMASVRVEVPQTRKWTFRAQGPRPTTLFIDLFLCASRAIMQSSNEVP